MTVYDAAFVIRGVELFIVGVYGFALWRVARDIWRRTRRFRCGGR